MRIIRGANRARCVCIGLTDFSVARLNFFTLDRLYNFVGFHASVATIPSVTTITKVIRLALTSELSEQRRSRRVVSRPKFHSAYFETTWH